MLVCGNIKVAVLFRLRVNLIDNFFSKSDANDMANTKQFGDADVLLSLERVDIFCDQKLISHTISDVNWHLSISDVFIGKLMYDSVC